MGAQARDKVSEARLYGTRDNGSAALPARWSWLATLAALVAFALLALTLAHWGWQWFGPAPAVVAAPVPDTDHARRLADAHLFGTPAAAPPPGAVATTTSLGDLRLLGVIVQRDGRGYALFRAAARGPLLIAVGQDVASGVRLESIRASGVTLIDNGVRRDIQLRTPIVGDKPDRPRVAVAATSAASPCAAPAGFTGPVVRLNAELLGGMMNTSDAWKALVEQGAGGLIVRDQSGFAANLGLKNGDRIESANGVALAIPGDIPMSVLQPLTRSQPVWLSGIRDGKVQHWLYLNAGACPA
jgi:general secretion pathway protein C